MSEQAALASHARRILGSMIDCGLRAPPSIIQAVRSSESLEIKTFCKDGASNSLSRMIRARTDLSTAELNIAEKTHRTEDSRRFFWEITLPYLYGHLLELMGIESGRDMMGFATTKTNGNLNIALKPLKQIPDA